MKPKVFKIDPHNIDLRLISQAAEAIHNRRLVAFPTETVYGLGANALDPKAVTGIFEAKKRPLDDPLIVHISKMGDLHTLARVVPLELEKLVHRFWPGPLTVILKKTELVPDLVSTGLDTVAIRMPSNPIAREFIQAAGTPIAAPSANMFGRPSPTTAQHVIDDLDGRIDIVLDGGKTEIGVESTVVEYSHGQIVVLRPGGVTIEDLRLIAGKINVFPEARYQESSPGKYPQHYSPNAKVILADNDPHQKENVLHIAHDEKTKGNKVGIMARQENQNAYREFSVKVLGPGNDGRICASRLFDVLREFDKEKVDIIVAEGIPEDKLGLAVMNRLRKAAGPEFAHPAISVESAF